MYVLVLFSKSELGLEFWRKTVAARSTPQLDLFSTGMS
jgi:hypothetical protein